MFNSVLELIHYSSANTAFNISCVVTRASRSIKHLNELFVIYNTSPNSFRGYVISAVDVIERVLIFFW